MRKYLIICAALSLTGAACASSQDEQVRDARMAQAEERAEANESAVENQASARADAIDERYDQRAEHVAESGGPGADAAEEMVGVSKERAEFQSEAKEDLGKLAVRIDAAHDKIMVLGGKAPTALKGELATTMQQYKMLQQDITNLDETGASAWESTTEDIDQRMAKLDDRVEDLTEAIDDV
jgi:hypothetical protein